MLQVEYRFLTGITSGIIILMGLYLLLLYRSTSGVKGIGYWAIGSLIVGVGQLFRLFPSLGSFSVIVVPTIFSTIGLYLYLAGIWQFKGKVIRHWIIFGLPLVNLVQSIVFYQFIPSNRIRGILLGIILLINCVLAIYEMFQVASDQKYLKQLFRINGVAFFIFAMLLVLSIVAVSVNPGFDPTKIDDFVLIRLVIAGILMIALTFGFMSAVNIQLKRQLEEQLASRNKFFRIIAHDLRGSLGTMTKFLNLLNNEPDLVEQELKSNLTELEQLSGSTYHLLQNLLEWSSNYDSLSKLKEEMIEIDHLVKDHIEHFKSLAKFKSIHVEYEKSAKALIKGHRKMLETVLRNVLSNALKFTPENGTISIKTESKSEKVYLRIKDSGVGIPPEKLDEIFKFEASRSSLGTNGEVGSGFGLVVCRDFVQKNNGSIRIDSQLNSGTEVILEFPAVP
ncbi:MAG TPA: HAMP domain-containing sensor histidine kinase [Sunxiuqinia sp.]|nr:HAMP domain-containing sensor histidine kinase [Sunxiuqinia sp.]